MKRLLIMLEGTNNASYQEEINNLIELFKRGGILNSYQVVVTDSDLFHTLFNKESLQHLLNMLEQNEANKTNNKTST